MSPLFLLFLSCTTGPKIIKLPGVHAEVPNDSVVLAPSSTHQLTDSATRSDAEADVQIRAVAAPGSPDVPLFVVLRVHQSPGVDRGMSLEQWTAFNVRSLAEHAKKQRIPSTQTSSCEADACTFDYSLGTSIHRRTRFTHLAGRLLAASCQCPTAGCLEKCSLKAP